MTSRCCWRWRSVSHNPTHTETLNQPCGTPLEQRFSRAQTRQMCSAAGLVDLRFSPGAPYWCVVVVQAGGA